MEGYWRDDPVTDGQNGKIRFINAMLGMNVHPGTKGEAYDFIDEYGEAADAEKKRREAEKAEREKRAELCDPIIESLQRKRKQTKTRLVPDMSDAVVMDYDALKAIAKNKRVKIDALNAAIGQAHSYLSYRATVYGGTIPRDYAFKMADELGVEPHAFVPEMASAAELPVMDEPEQMVMDLEEEAADNFDIPYVEGIVHFPIEKDRKKFEAIIHALDVPVNNALTMAFVQWFMDMSEKSVDELAEMLEE